VTRRRHNNELAAREGHSPLASVTTPVAPWRETPVSLLAVPQAVRPSSEALVERLLRNVTRLGVPKGERPEGLTFEVILSPDEALWGVAVPVGIPGVRRCPDCDGTGRMWLFPCVSGGAEGVVATEQVIRIRIPPRVPFRVGHRGTARRARNPEPLPASSRADRVGRWTRGGGGGVCVKRNHLRVRYCRPGLGPRFNRGTAGRAVRRRPHLLRGTSPGPAPSTSSWPTTMGSGTIRG
jgi:hypothetical protein